MKLRKQLDGMAKYIATIIGLMLIMILWYGVLLTGLVSNLLMPYPHDITEAVYLADEIFIMKANPGMLVDRIKINLPSERRRELKRSPEFLRYVNQIEDRMFEVDAMSGLEG